MSFLPRERGGGRHIPCKLQPLQRYGTGKIPAGVPENLQNMRGVPGKRRCHSCPLQGAPGDLYIYLVVEPHPIFKREDDDIICEVPVSFPQAALGAEIEVPTLEGPAKLKIPPGTQTGKVFRLKGKGIGSMRTGRRGDEVVCIRIETPAKLNKRQKELLEEFASISGDEGYPQKKSFFDKVKEIF